MMFPTGGDEPLPENILKSTSYVPEDLPERYSPSGISIIIVGAGVAGLVAGLECWRKGHDVRLLERSPSRLLSGDSFSIGDSAIRALKLWPEIATQNDQIATEPWISWHKINGETISGPAPLQFSPFENHENGPQLESPRLWRHSRPKFHKMLTEQAAKAGVFVEFNKFVKEYVEGATGRKAGVILEDGQELEADLVIAADGVGSKSSRAVLGDEVLAHPTGFSIYRAAFPLDEAFVDPIVRERFALGENGQPLAELWMGKNIHGSFGRNQDEFSWTLTYPTNESSQESWSRLVEPSNVLEMTATIDGWPVAADRVIKLTPKNRLHDFKMMWRDPQPCWVSCGGRIVQIGDSAHTFPPSSGNGATQGIEDAVSLATVLQISGRDDISWAVRVHNKLRFERVSCLQKLGVINHQLRHRSANAQATQAKPFGLLSAWIWKHDPEAYAVENYRQALAHLIDGTAFSNTNTPPGHVHRSWTIGEIFERYETDR